MKYVIIVLVLIQASCFRADTDSTKASPGVRTWQCLAQLDSTGNRIIIDSSYSDVYTKGRIFLHDLTDHTFVSAFSAQAMVNGKPVAAKKEERYFIYSLDSLYGYEWNGDDMEHPERRSLADVLGHDWKKGTFTQAQRVFDRERFQFELLSSHSNKDSATLTEMYKLTDPKNSPSNITVWFTYSKQDGVPNVGIRKDMNIASISSYTECGDCRLNFAFKMESINANNKIESMFTAYNNITVPVQTPK
jgi:hypothetical protein